MLNNVCINGITPLECYPNCEHKKYYKQFMENEMLCIPPQKPDIESINEININVCIDEYSLINTLLGPKLVIKATKDIKIIYTANNCQQSIHSAHWSIPFCEYVLIKDEEYSSCNNLISSVFIGLEHVFIKYYNERFIDISLLLLLCPELNIVSESCDGCNTYYSNDKLQYYCECEDIICKSALNRTAEQPDKKRL